MCSAGADARGLVGEAAGMQHMRPLHCHALGMHVIVCVHGSSCHTSHVSMLQPWPHTKATTFPPVWPCPCPW